MATKWSLHRMYSKHPELRKILPPTAIMTPASLKQFMNKYGTVYIKGSNSHMGKGIVKAWKTADGYRFIRVRGKAVHSNSITDLYSKVRKGSEGQKLIVQKAIDLPRIKGRPYDIRVMLMRGGEGNWVYAGMLAKVAGSGSIISNVRRGGGYATTVDRALAQSLGYNKKQIETVKRKLIDKGFELVKYAVQRGSRSHESGIDMAVDTKGRTWNIEVNLIYPSHALFNKLSDKTFFRKIRRLASAYRRRLKRKKD